MGVVSKVAGMLFVTGAALVGNWVGNRVRGVSNGGTTPMLRVTNDTYGNRKGVQVNLTLSNLIPAVALAFFAGKPRSVYALIVGAMLSGLLGDRFENQFVRFVRSKIGTSM